VIPVIVFAFIAAGTAALLVSLAFVAVVAGIHATERRHALRQPGYGRTDTFTRRLLGVYVRQKPKADHHGEFARWLMRR
jgi:hypothetical protein